MKFLLLILFLLLIISSILAQSWQWENPKPMGDEIQQVYFIDSLNGWIVPNDNTILKTTNGGNNWKIIYTNIVFNNLFFVNKDEGWGIGRTSIQQDHPRSIYHTTDGGESWSIQFADTSTSNMIDTSAYWNIYFINRTNGWATTNDTFYPALRTTDGGITWNVGTNNSFRLGDGGTPKWVLFSDSLRGWIIGGLEYALITTDGGTTWLNDSTLHGYKIIKSDSLHLCSLAYSDITISIDGGKSWTIENFPNNSLYTGTNDIYMLDSNNVYVSSDSGLYKSNNEGINWNRISNQSLGSLWFLNNNIGWAGGVGYVSDIYNTTDAGITWNDMTNRNYPYGDDNYQKVDFINQDTGWICIQSFNDLKYSQVIKTTNGGITWKV